MNIARARLGASSSPTSIVITAIGLIVGYRVRQSGEYFLGGRKFGPWLMIGQSFGVGTHAEMPVALAGAVYSVGASAIWYQWKNLFITPFYWIMAPVFRRIRRTTMAEFTEDRYGSWMGAIYIVFALCFFIINTGSMLKGAGKVISQATGGGVGVNEIVVAMTVMFILYSFVGGLVAAAWTDLFQGFLIIVLSFMLIPLGWQVVGGLDGMRASLEPFRFSLATPSGIGPWVIAMLTVNGLVGIMAQPQQLAAVGTGKRRAHLPHRHALRQHGQARLHGRLGARRADRRRDDRAGPRRAPRRSAIRRTRSGSPAGSCCFPGALGLMIASILAANMSTCSAFLVDSGALFTEGLYRPRLAPGRPDRHYLWVGRVSGFAITMLGVLYAMFLIDSVLYTFLLTETLATFVGISVLGGISVAAREPLGRARQPAERARDELPPLLPDRPAARSLGRECLSRRAARRHRGARRRQPADGARAGGADRRRSSRGCRRRATGPTKPMAAADRRRRDRCCSSTCCGCARAARGRGWRAFREDLGGFALGWAIVVVLVVATAVFLAP